MPVPRSKILIKKQFCGHRGGVAVLTGDDIPGNIVGFALGDKPPLTRYKVRHYGDPLAAVVADNEAETKRRYR